MSIMDLSMTKFKYENDDALLDCGDDDDDGFGLDD